ncbi:MAG: hypothetical protein GX650_05000, partial [Clostridiales bacterium]|nr:hypothetical protein [Clostridiales bacterium]
MRRFLSIVLVLCMALALPLMGAAATYKAGTYTASAQGMGGMVSLTV